MGVDTSRAKLVVAFADGRDTLTIDNSQEQIVSELIGSIDNPELTIVVMEATGGFEHLLVKTIEQRLANCVAADTVNAHKVEIMQSVKGLGPVAVSTFLAE